MGTQGSEAEVEDEGQREKEEEKEHCNRGDGGERIEQLG